MMLAATVLCTKVHKVTIFHHAINTAFLSRSLTLRSHPDRLILTQVVPAWPHLTSLLKTDQQYNLITAALQRETSVNTSPFYLLIHLDK